MAWKDGFKVGYEMSKIEIPSMSAELAQYQKSIDQRKLLKAQGEAAEASRRASVIDATGKNMSFFTTGFDDTGISDYDALADKVLNTFDNASAMNNWKFRNGQMSEEEYKGSQNKLIRAFGNINSVYENINSKATEQAKLSEEGKDNIVNTFKAELIELYGNRVSFEYENGEVKMTTIGPNGQEITAAPSLLKSLSTNDAGADINSAVEELVRSKGTSKYFNEDFSKKYTSYSFNDKNVLDLVGVTVNSFNENQVIDAAFKLGILSTDPKEAEENEGIEYMDFLSWSTVDKDKIDKLKGSVKQAMADHTKEMFRLKFSSEQMKPEKAEDTLIVSPITTDATLEQADIAKTFFEAQEGEGAFKSIENTTNPFADPNITEAVTNAFAEFNPDLVEKDEESGKFKMIDPNTLDIKAVNVPLPFSAKEIMNIGVSSSSDKQWDNIDGFVLVKSKIDDVDDEEGEIIPSNYSIRIRGSVISDKGKAKESAQTAKQGQGVSVQAEVVEQSFSRIDDVSAPIGDQELGRVWSVYISKNKELSKAYQLMLNRAKTENLDLSDPSVSRRIIGQTIEQFFSK
jgi:hypothetical protein